MRHAALWAVIAAFVVLAARSLAYALATPTPLSATLEHQAGGPRLVVTTLVALTLAIAVASAVLWLAATAVRERHVLQGGSAPPPALPLAALARRTFLLLLAGSLLFALVESYVHLRAGLGFHGLACVVGPVHRDALPLLAALSLLAVAAHGAAVHVLSWMRRTLRLLLRKRCFPLARPPELVGFARAQLLRSHVSRAHSARGPPVVVTDW